MDKYHQTNPPTELKSVVLGRKNSRKGASSPAPCSRSSMYRAWAAFVDICRERAHEFPQYDGWILSSDPECRAFRQGWAARWNSEQDPDYYPDPTDSENTKPMEGGKPFHAAIC